MEEIVEAMKHLVVDQGNIDPFHFHGPRICSIKIAYSRHCSGAKFPSVLHPQTAVTAAASRIAEAGVFEAVRSEPGDLDQLAIPFIEVVQ